MKTVKFPREYMRDLLWGGAEGAKVVEDVLTGTGRWTINHRLTFEQNGVLYQTTYREGATECQDERPWEYVSEVECVVVRPVEKTVVVYEPVEEDVVPEWALAEECGADESEG